MSQIRYLMCAVVLAGCMASSPDQPSTDDAQYTVKGTGKCMPSVCGSHSPALLECTYFSLLSSEGVANDQDVRIISVHRADGTAMRLIADLDRLRGVHPTTGAPLAEHGQLEGTVIIAMMGTATRTITIEHVALADERFWVGAFSRVEAYDLAYTPATGVGAPQHVRAIAFTGDLYDPMTKQVSVGPATEGWINFACKDSTLYRQHLLGHTEAAQTRLGIATTLAKRQAMLNALTMNACGTGRTWTADAEPLTLTESQLLLPSSSPYQVAPATYEAIWKASGAVCVNVPRLATSAAMVTETLAAMSAECGAPMPPCTSAMLANWQLYGEVVTGNPPGSTP